MITHVPHTISTTLERCVAYCYTPTGVFVSLILPKLNINKNKKRYTTQNNREALLDPPLAGKDPDGSTFRQSHAKGPMIVVAGRQPAGRKKKHPPCRKLPTNYRPVFFLRHIGKNWGTHQHSPHRRRPGESSRANGCTASQVGDIVLAKYTSPRLPPSLPHLGAVRWHRQRWLDYHHLRHLRPCARRHFL